MTASEARELAINTNDANTKEQLSKIMHDIKIAAGSGELSVTVYLEINNATNKKLIDNGYKVVLRQTGPNESGYLISW